MKENEKLTEKEVRQIKKYCLMPRLVMPILGGIALMLVVIVIMQMIADIGFDARQTQYRDVLFIVVMVICGVLTVAMCCFMMIPVCGMRGKKWGKILSKLMVSQQAIQGREAAVAGMGLGALAGQMKKSDNDTISGMGTAAQVASFAAGATAAHQMSASAAANASAVADAWDIPVKKYKGLRRLCLLLPALLMIVLHIPECVMANQASQQRVADINRMEDQIELAMEQTGRKVFRPTVRSDMHAFYIQFTDEEVPYQPQVKFDIDESQLVTSLSWSVVENPDLTPEENVANLQKFMESTLVQIRSCPVNFWSEHIASDSQLTMILAEKYLQDPTAEHIHMDTYDMDMGQEETTFSFTVYRSYDGTNELHFYAKQNR